MPRAQSDEPTERPDGDIQGSLILNIEQSKTLAEPFRQRILEQLVLEPLTAKQVGDRLGEPRSRIYHHFEVLERVGLIRLVETKPKRGTVERYYRAVAGEFNADPRLFRVGPVDPELQESAAQVVAAIFRTAAEDVGSSIASKAYREGDILNHLFVRASEQTIADLRKRLHQWLEDCSKANRKDGEVEYRVTVAFHRAAGDGPRRKRLSRD